MTGLLLHPDGILVVGVEDDRETGGVRVYVGARYLNTYALLVDPEHCAAARRAWHGSSGHVVANRYDLWPFHDEGCA